MSEKDVFERRLADALRRYAAEMDEDVDPMAVAHRVALEHPRARTTWRTRLTVRPGLLARPVPALVVVGMLVALLVASIQLVPSELRGPAASAPFWTGPTYLAGTETRSLVNAGTSATVGEVRQVRGRIVSTTDATDDPMVAGGGTLQIDIDMNGNVGTEWGTYRIENAAGAWQGSVTGATDASGSFEDISGWLVGSGNYQGFTYYFHARGTSVVTIDGIVFPGSPPAETAPAGSIPTGSPAAS